MPKHIKTISIFGTLGILEYQEIIAKILEKDFSNDFASTKSYFLTEICMHEFRPVVSEENEFEKRHSSNLVPFGKVRTIEFLMPEKINNFSGKRFITISSLSIETMMEQIEK